MNIWKTSYLHAGGDVLCEFDLSEVALSDGPNEAILPYMRPLLPIGRSGVAACRRGCDLAASAVGTNLTGGLVRRWGVMMTLSEVVLGVSKVRCRLRMLLLSRLRGYPETLRGIGRRYTRSTGASL